LIRGRENQRRELLQHHAAVVEPPEPVRRHRRPQQIATQLPMRPRDLMRAWVGIVENIFEDGDWAILEWRDPLGLRGGGFFHVVNDKIVFQRGYWDKLSFLRLHGLPAWEP
jgi:hypothetical protein